MDIVPPDTQLRTPVTSTRHGRWFTDIRAFDVRQVDPNAAPVAQSAPVMQNVPVAEANPEAPFPPQQETAGESADELPF